VNRYIGRPRRQNAQVRYQPLQAVLGDERNSIARLNANAQPSMRRAIDHAAVTLPADVTVQAPSLGPQRGTRTQPIRLTLEHLYEVLLFGCHAKNVGSAGTHGKKSEGVTG